MNHFFLSFIYLDKKWLDYSPLLSESEFCATVGGRRSAIVVTTTLEFTLKKVNFFMVFDMISLLD